MFQHIINHNYLNITITIYSILVSYSIQVQPSDKITGHSIVGTLVQIQVTVSPHSEYELQQASDLGACCLR